MSQQPITRDHRGSKESVTFIVNRKTRVKEDIKEILMVYLVRHYVSKTNMVFIQYEFGSLPFFPFLHPTLLSLCKFIALTSMYGSICNSSIVSFMEYHSKKKPQMMKLYTD